MKKMLLWCSIFCTLCSCDISQVNFGEQYKKILYIVNSSDVLFKNEHFFEKEKDSITISVYCGGSELIKQDISVQLELDPKALDSLNRVKLLVNPSYKNKVLLPPENYTFSTKSVVIKKGEEYGVAKIPFTVKGLDVDEEYVLPVKIFSNNQNFEINPKLNTIIYEIHMVNYFSGDYSGSSKELPKTIRSVQPHLKAISSNSVRMPIHDLPSDVKFLETNFMLLTIADDSVTVHISPWKSAKITDLGGSTYDKDKKLFDLYYSIIIDSGNELVINEKIRSILAPEEDED